MSTGARRFSPGEVVEIREVRDAKIWTVRPVTVVEDTDEAFVSYLAPGTLCQYPVGVTHGEKCFQMWLSGEWELEKKVFNPPGVLRIAPTGAPFEVFASVDSAIGVTRWYVNFQEPLRRRAHGFDTMDETLDLIVSSDLTTWHRDDEDELELAAAMGVYSEDDVRRLVATCVTLEDQLARGAVPWDLRWSTWVPHT
jgi:predicted RNA-binding protein associated with RNAse of E/G family